ncbi:MAG: MoaD/ThiS family protein [Nitrososphaerota archaeon]|jgi:molybdopterin converting factor small subunit|uniref:MoaD/ThiS family protein n=1 Tax=Candidatus Bathycorpusculum sp. TaxID=2994959 RepID=UPI002832D74B|nr:MoaD/ThiS family protein [Candidatus Termiticorpusculum sp.]MCL2256897.1 MoaD/ThiS family protein [Candidatus Termiticorpusculum sp.]MCL2293001.1 MoaD/ThiS family protein [Candidatus Termiticorpusculum sp.]MDR0460514.1 MoaD/ThiS family protein [Nitrososphaerota archaeon]
MAINIKFVGALRHIAGKSKKVTIDNNNCIANFTVNDLIQKTITDIPEIKADIITQQTNGATKLNVLILVNDREISVLNGIDTVLSNGDEVVFIPVVHGG